MFDINRINHDKFLIHSLILLRKEHILLIHTSKLFREIRLVLLLLFSRGRMMHLRNYNRSLDDLLVCSFICNDMLYNTRYTAEKNFTIN